MLKCIATECHFHYTTKAGTVSGELSLDGLWFEELNSKHKDGDVVETKLRDHMANERTFLAWLRTAMAVIAFGFVLDRFSLYIHYLPPTGVQPSSQVDVRLVAAGLMWIGTFLIPAALYHFITVQRDIDRSVAVKTHTWLVVLFGSLVTIIAMYLTISLIRMG